MRRRKGDGGVERVAVVSGLVTIAVACMALWPSMTAAQGFQLEAGQNTSAPATITLQDALRMAKARSPDLERALAQYGIAQGDRVQAQAANLPSLAYNNTFLYTEGNGTPSGRFIANNGVHEYISQSDAHETISMAQIADVRRTVAAEAAARARVEIAARGLVVTVVQSYSALAASQHKYADAQLAVSTARDFLTTSEELEKGGEVAHSDVIKAEIQFQDQQRTLQEARLAMEQDRIALALLLFPNFNQNFQIIDNLETTPPLPGFAELEEKAATNNPEPSAALAALQEADRQVSVAKAGYLPVLSLDAFYGIDANHFATETTDPLLGEVQNLGYSAQATLNIPIWNWGATRSKVRQSQLLRKQAEVELAYARRKALADLNGFYAEAQTAQSEVETLRQSASLAAESARLTVLRYRAGEATALEVVDAQNTLVRERNAYDDAEARYAVALANLERLTGTL